MLKFRSVTITNFMSYHNATLPLDELGAVLVLGENATSGSLSSNGSGKTALAEAIFWCLFGKTFRDIPTASVVNKDALEDCSVSVDYDVNGVRGSILRRKGGPKEAAKLYIQEGENTVTYTNDAATIHLNELLNWLTPEQFCNLVFFGRDYKMKLFHEMNDAERKELFETVCPSLGIIGRIHELLKSHEKVDSATIANIKHEIDILEANIRLNDERVEDARLRHCYAIERAQEDLRSANAMVASRNKALDKLPVIKKPDPPRLSKLEDEIAHLQRAVQVRISERDKIKEFLAGAKERICPTCKRPWPRTEEVKVDTEAQLKKLAEVDFVKSVEQKKLKELYELRTKRMEEYHAAVDKYTDNEAKRASVVSNEVVEGIVRKASARLAELEAVAEPAEEWIARKVQWERDLDALRAELTSLEETQRRRGIMLSVTADSGLKAYLLDELLAKLEQEASRMSVYLSNGELDIQISNAGKGDFRKREGTIVIRAFNQHGADLYAGNSSGERTRVDLCILFALVLTVRDLYGVDVRFMFLDEVLDSLDDAGVESVIDLIQKEIVPVKGTVLLTSHNDSLKSLFDRAILVKKVRGVSEVQNG